MDLREALQSKGIQFRNQSKPNEVWICCPFCPDKGEALDTRFRLGVNIKSGLAHCFNCGFDSHNVLSYLAHKIDLGEVQSGVVEQEKKSHEVVRLPKDFQLLTRKAAEHDELVAQARKYIRHRRVTSHQLKSKEIGVSFTGKYQYRIVFPVAYDGELLGLVARDFTGKQEPKYLNSAGMRALYNVPRRKQKSIILSEGVIKALYLETQLGVPSASLLGHTITTIQEDMLKGFTDVVLWPDPDPVGIKGILKIAQQLSGRYQVWLPKKIPLQQADEMSQHDIKRTIQGLAPFTTMMELRYKKHLMDLREL